jgi:hypothetical protein
MRQKKLHEHICTQKLLTLSGIHMIFVVGYGWSNVLFALNSEVSSSSETICTLLLYSSTKLPSASLKQCTSSSPMINQHTTKKTEVFWDMTWCGLAASIFRVVKEHLFRSKHMTES